MQLKEIENLTKSSKHGTNNAFFACMNDGQVQTIIFAIYVLCSLQKDFVAFNLTSDTTGATRSNLILTQINQWGLNHVATMGII